MFTFNRNEQIAILGLTALLIVGSVVSAYDYFWPSDVEDFEVRKNAIPVPEIPDEKASPSAAPSGPIDVNTATAAELTGLPQIGPKTAERIVAYREANGPFGTLDDLARVKGIGPKTLSRLRPHATVTPP